MNFPPPVDISLQKLRRGFTLLEMIMVILVMAVLMGLLVPALIGGNSTKITTTSRELSGYLGAARADAIARHTAVRFGVVVWASANPEWEYRRYGLWEWDKPTETFILKSELKELPEGLLFEESELKASSYIATADYAATDNYAVQGTHFVDTLVTGAKFIGPGNTQPQIYGNSVEVQYIEFRPSGSIRIDGGAQKRHFSVILVPGIRDAGVSSNTGAVTDWAHINLDSFTGRVRIYRP